MVRSHVERNLGEHDRAAALLDAALVLLTTRANRLNDEATRRSYLTNVPTNHALRDLANRRNARAHSRGRRMLHGWPHPHN